MTSVMLTTFSSILQCLLSGDRSTVRLGDPSCLRVTTMRWHHSTGSPNGTRSITPSASSCSKSSCTLSAVLVWPCHTRQWLVGTCVKGGATIVFKQPVMHLAVVLWVGNGRDVGRGGTGVLFGQSHTAPSSSVAPQIETTDFFMVLLGLEYLADDTKGNHRIIRQIQ